MIFSYNSLNRNKENWEKFRKKVYPTPAPIPPMPWKESPKTGILSGKVLDRKGNPVEDAILEIEGHPQKWTSGEDGFFAFTGLEPGPKTLRVTHGKTSLFSPIDIEAGEVLSIRCLLVETDSESLRFRMISPRRVKTSTSREYVNIAGHTGPENKAFINGEEIHIYRTGIFVADQIPLDLGINKIEIAIETPTGIRLQRIRWVERTHPKPLAILPALPLQIDPKSVEPRFDYLVQPGDHIPVGFKGSPGHQAKFRIGKRGPWQPMTELPPEEQKGMKGLYSREYIVQPEDEFDNTLINFRLLRNREVEGATRSPGRITTLSKATISKLDPATPIIAEVSEEFADLKVGLGQVRLGGPILSTVPQGTRLELSGKIGRNWRVRLSDTTQAWIGEDSIQLLPPGTHSARGFVTYFSVEEDDRYDLIKIPLPRKRFLIESNLSMIPTLY